MPFILLLVFTALWPSIARAEDPVGWVSSLEGTAEVQRGSETQPLAAGGPLQLRDRVRTGAASRLKLLFRDDSVVTLAESSELLVDEQVAGAAPVSAFSLLRGQLRALVAKRYGAAGSSFEVSTPTAVAGVRGTEFLAVYDAAAEETLVVGLDDVTVVRGVLAGGAGRSVKVGPGESTRVRRGGYPSKPVALPEATIRSLTGPTGQDGGGSEPADDEATQKGGDPRSVRKPGDRDGSPEGRVIDQPLDVLKKNPNKLIPPPPPVR